MKKLLIGMTISLVLAAGVALPPTPALAQRRGFQGQSRPAGRVMAGGPAGAHSFAQHRFVPQSFGRHQFGSHSFARRPFGPQPFVRHPFGPHPFPHRPFFRPFVPFGVVGSSVVVYAPPPVYYPVYYDAPRAYYEQPTYYAPSAVETVAVAPSPPPTPSVIQYATGRYELRGDGITTPYVWVWIPNPPSAPPPPAAPPSEPPAAPESAPSDPSAAPHSRIYRWTDDAGVVHWTNSREAVPEQYRLQMKPPRPS